MSENINNKKEIQSTVKIKSFFQNIKKKLIIFGELIIKYSEEILRYSFYLLSIYFICLGVYFAFYLFYKLYEIIQKLFLNNTFMTNLDLLSTNCVTHSDYENFSNKGEIVEGFVDTLIIDNTTEEILKISDGIPVKYFNTNLEKYLDLYLCDFYWPSSYKTYIPSGTNKGRPTYEALKRALLDFKVRTIYLDIYSSSDTIGDESAIPVVRSSSLYYNFDALDFFKCLQTIKRYSWYDDSTKKLPLILYLNIEFSPDSILYEKVYYAIMKVFYSHLISKKYSFAGRGGIFPPGKIKMSDAIGKLILISNVYPTRTKLDEIINGYSIDTSGSYCYINQYTSDQNEYGGLLLNNTASELINNHKTNIEFIFSNNNSDTGTISNSKVDLMNPNFTDCCKYGLQFVLMSLYYPDDYLNSWYSYFKKNNFRMVLKPKSLRYIPTKSNIVTQQNPLLSFETKKYNMPVSGFFSTNKSGIS
jgi:hypothetical protein